MPPGREEIKAILIIRLSAIGDIVMASPLIKALRGRYPRAHIAWLVQAEAADLLNRNAALDEVIIWPRQRWQKFWSERKWHTLLGELSALRATLRTRRFDLAVDAQGLMKSGLLARLSGARTRIGLDSREGSGLLMTRVIDTPSGDKRIGSEYRHLAESLGLNTDTFAMEIALGEDDLDFARRRLLECGVSGPYAVLCPFTTRPQKHWIAERWAVLARELRTRFGLTAVVLGGSRDAAPAKEIAAAADGNVQQLAGATSLRQAAAIIRGAALLVGVDTGLTHMGTAFATPTVALFGSTCPYLDAGLETTAVIYKNLPCAPCKRRPTCHGAYTCMRDITVDDIMATAARLHVTAAVKT